MDEFSRQIAFLEQHSTYARRWLNARPEWANWLRTQGPKKLSLSGIQDLLAISEIEESAASQDESRFMANLRLARQRLMLWIAFRDLNGLADLDEVTHSLSQFAELAIAKSIAYIRQDLSSRFGLPWSNTSQIGRAHV